MTFNQLLKELKKQYIVEKQKGCNVYQIDVGLNLDGITISESFSDYRISFWQEGVGVQMAMKKPEDILNCINSLTW